MDAETLRRALPRLMRAILRRRGVGSTPLMDHGVGVISVLGAGEQSALPRRMFVAADFAAGRTILGRLIARGSVDARRWRAPRKLIQAL